MGVVVSSKPPLRLRPRSRPHEGCSCSAARSSQMSGRHWMPQSAASGSSTMHARICGRAAGGGAGAVGAELSGEVVQACREAVRWCAERHAGRWAAIGQGARSAGRGWVGRKGVLAWALTAEREKVRSE
eukprot:86339-Chlamydomonas_euryale.AAC.2